MRYGCFVSRSSSSAEQMPVVKPNMGREARRRGKTHDIHEIELDGPLFSNLNVLTIKLHMLGQESSFRGAQFVDVESY